uniref:Uncharacterized protein n=1 Tax=Cannabis sativa TaxID=3483 RepID=A0A803PF29_CANSA
MLSHEKSLLNEMPNKPDTTMEDLLARTSNLTVLDEDGWEINPNGGSEVASFWETLFKSSSESSPSQNHYGKSLGSFGQRMGSGNQAFH